MDSGVVVAVRADQREDMEMKWRWESEWIGVVSIKVQTIRAVAVRGSVRGKTDKSRSSEGRAKDRVSVSGDETETEVGYLEPRCDRGCSRKVEDRRLHVAVDYLR